MISKLMTELYGGKRLSVSSVAGGDYQASEAVSSCSTRVTRLGLCIARFRA